MSSKTTILFLGLILLFANGPRVLAQSGSATGDQRIRTQVNNLGPGKKVTVFLKDGRKLKGSISQILDDSFDITPDKQTQSSIISYRDVENVKKRGWPTATKVALGVGGGVALMIGVIFLISKT